METKELPDLLRVPWVEAPVGSEQEAVVSDQRSVISDLDPEEIGVAGRDWTRWEDPVLAAGFCWTIAVGIGAVTGLIPLGVVSWQLVVVVVAAVALAVGLAVTCPKAPEQEQFWSWGSEATAYTGQCAPSRNTLTGRG